MSRLLGWWARLSATLRPGPGEERLNEELESHIALDMDERIRRGASPEEARRAALLALGGLETTKEGARDQLRLRGLENVLRDARHALRLLLRERLFSVVVVLSFAIGIGANTAIFSAVNAVLLHPLPYADAERLVTLWSTDRLANDGIMPVTPGDFGDFRNATHSYDDLAAATDAVFTVTGDGAAETVIGNRFAPEMFRVLGVPAALGRTFAPGDGADVVVLSDRFWRRRYGGDPGVIGRSLTLDQKEHTIVGVMPPAFTHPQQAELWTPLVIAPRFSDSRERVMLRVVARLRPGVTVAAARADLRAVAAHLAAAHPATNYGRSAEVLTLRSLYSGDARPALLVLLGAVGFLLLLTSTNIAGLSIARSTARSHELAVRGALGASRLRIVQQLLTETLVLAALGGVAGLLLALWGADLLVQLFPKNVANLHVPTVERIPLDRTVVLFSFGVTLVAGVLAGLLPALRVSRPDLFQTLKQGGRGTTRTSRLRPFLVAGQIALALVLTSCAGLLIRSGDLRRRALGFDPAHLFTARLLHVGIGNPDPERPRRVLADVLAALRASPGVTSVGAVNFLPLSGWSGGDGASFHLPGRPADEQGASMFAADAAYFTTMRIPVVRGRGFAASDDMAAPKVLLVDEHFARRWLAGVEPTGTRLNLGSDRDPDWRTIIGVVGDVMNDVPSAEQRPAIYEPLAQSSWRIFGLVVRTPGNPVAVAATVRDVVASVDPLQPVSYGMQMEDLVDDALAVSRTSTYILSFFALVALLVAAMGVYGVLAQHVLERRHEIAIRLALGARRRHIVATMMRSWAFMSGGGLALGLVGTLVTTRLLQTLLYGVSPQDPLLLTMTGFVLLGATALSAWFPLRRALQTDPIIALREE